MYKENHFSILVSGVKCICIYNVKLLNAQVGGSIRAEYIYENQANI